eukprot:4918365-Amphidinium_carterae.1
MLLKDSSSGSSAGSGLALIRLSRLSNGSVILVHHSLDSLEVIAAGINGRLEVGGSTSGSTSSPGCSRRRRSLAG